MPSKQQDRNYLKAGDWEKWSHVETDQRKGVPAPPLQKPYDASATLVSLVAPEDLTVGQMPLIDAIRRRQSRRQYTAEPLTLEELSFLLWATQGIRQVSGDGTRSLRTVPSAGARHPFETYLLVNRVTSVAPGLYRYLPLDHKLCLLSTDADLTARVHAASREQYVTDSAVTFVWTALPYRTEWRYATFSYKVIAMDAGHLCQNLYLAAEVIGAGTCAIGAYNQTAIDAVLGIDGEEEFTIYIAPVGKIRT